MASLRTCFASIAALLAGLLLTLAAAQAQQPPGAAVPPPQPAAAPAAAVLTPRATVAAFLKAADEGDAAALAALSSGDASQQKWLRARATRQRAVRELQAALAKRFGPDYAQTEAGKSTRESIEDATDDELESDLKDAKLHWGGPERVTVIVAVDETKNDEEQPRLVRADGVWKLDLASVADYMDERDVPGYLAVARAASQLAADVAAGKFDTPDKAAETIDEALTAAQERAAAANPPAARPSK